MKLNSCALTLFATLGLSACSSAPKTTLPEFGVLEKVENLTVAPNTQNNSAQLVKFLDHCIIEFSAQLKTAQANEKWRFKGNSLMAASSTILQQDGTSTGQNFDLNDAAVQANFLALKSHFSQAARAACQ